jgi:hypothetical protein
MTRQIALLALLAAAVAAFFLAGGHEHLDFDNLQARERELEALYAQRPAAFAAIFFLVYVAVATTSVPGGAVLTMGAGAIFGVALGTLLVSFASTIGAPSPSCSRATCSATGYAAASRIAWRSWTKGCGATVRPTFSWCGWCRRFLSFS